MAPSLDSLPPELLFEIIDYLQSSARLSLTLVSKHFQSWIPTESKTLLKDRSRCEAIAVRRFLQESQNRRSRKRRCVVCRGLYPEDFFRRTAPICNWHDGWFMATTLSRHVEKSVMDRLEKVNPRKTCWFALEREFCVHKREIVGWSVPDCRCNCDSCGHFEVTCYVRRSSQSNRPARWELSENGLGVVEEGFVDGNGRNQSSNMRGLNMLTTDVSRQRYKRTVPVLRLNDVKS